jgi:hypothetical protein
MKPKPHLLSKLILKQKVKASTQARLYRNLVVLRELNDVDYAATTLGAKLYFACCKSKQCVVFATAYFCAWVKVGSTLTNNDFTGVDFLTCVALYSETLGV